ncbi:MAG: acyl-CoA synthetase, partial [Acidobacteriota bacterium]
CDGAGEHTYERLDEASAAVAAGLLGAARADLGAARIAYLLEPGFEHVAVQWGIWRAGGVAVPLAPAHPAPELAGIIADARPRVVVAEPALQERAREAVASAVGFEHEGAAEEQARANDERAAPVMVRNAAELLERSRTSGDERAGDVGALPAIDVGRPALMVYTSGTTGRPKGVVTTHANLAAQVDTLRRAWAWSEDDRILHVLPLHHVHGIVNALTCALASGACCEFSPPEARGIWDRFAAGGISLFMAVPTIYRRLIALWEAAAPDERERWTAGAGALRLMVSGSAALPPETLTRWQEITGQRLLERYGMTEIGMALSNPLHGERRPGTVGQPLPDVEARIVDEQGEVATAAEQGEIQVRGPQVFREYWRRPDATAAAFTEDGWFRTGDEGAVEDGYWRIIGRRSVDIIKTGGYKVSALEIEAVLRRHPAVDDAAVVGVADDDWGERVCAAVIAAGTLEAMPAELVSWCKEHLAPYKVPKRVVVVSRLPRNTMGKVTKAALHPLFFDA